jgi:hypothetical protein
MTKSEIVLEAIASRSGYRELDYVHPRTHLLLRVVQISHGDHRRYRVHTNVSLLRRPTSSVAAPKCPSQS